MAAKTPEQKHPSTSKILIVDDHPVFRRGVSALIDSEPNLTVCGEADNGKEALDLIDAKQPDVVIVDLVLEVGDGLELVKAIKARHPHIHSLVLSMHGEAVYAERSLRAGANGYVSKVQADETVLVALRCILAGETYMSDALKTRLATKFVSGRTLITTSAVDALSDRELQVFELIGRGLTTRKIATTLNLSVKTIESHVEHIKQKLNLESAAELHQHAFRWIEAGDTG